jgi:phage baseplate assembly protein W
MAIDLPYRVDRTGRTAAPAGPAEHARALIEQVLFTAPGERVMRPGFGTGVYQLVFAPAGDQAAVAAQHLVSGALQQWLAAWIEVREVTVTGGDGILEVTVAYRLRETGDDDTATFRLAR